MLKSNLGILVLSETFQVFKTPLSDFFDSPFSTTVSFELLSIECRK